MSKKPEALVEPSKPLRTRVPFEGPSPREYELLAIVAKRALSAQEQVELVGEQNSRTEHEANWAEYREAMQAYHAQLRAD